MPRRELRIGHGEAYMLLADPEMDGDGEPWTVQTTLVLPGLRAEARVWLGREPDERPSPENGLPAFFATLAQEWRGWEGVPHWSAGDESLRLEAKTDRLGHVSLHVALRNSTGKWTIEGDVRLAAGQLEGVAKEVGALLVTASLDV